MWWLSERVSIIITVYSTKKLVHTEKVHSAYKWNLLLILNMQWSYKQLTQLRVSLRLASLYVWLAKKTCTEGNRFTNNYLTLHQKWLYMCTIYVFTSCDELTHDMQRWQVLKCVPANHHHHPHQFLLPPVGPSGAWGCKLLGLLINSKLSSFQQIVYSVLTNEQTSSLNCSIPLCVCVTFLPFGWEQEKSTVKMQLYRAVALQKIVLASV